MFSIVEATAAVQAGIFKKSAKPQAASNNAIETVFSEIDRRVKSEGAALVKEVKGKNYCKCQQLSYLGVFIFNIENDTWVVDLKNGNGSVTKGAPASEPEGSVTITVESADFVDIVSGKLDAQSAWAQGKLQLGGNMMLAMKLQVLFNKKSKL